MLVKWIGFVALGLLVACSSDSGDDDSGGGDDDSNESGSSSGSSSSSSKFTCKINGSCKECPTSADVSKCASGEENDCTSAADSVCD